MASAPAAIAFWGIVGQIDGGEGGAMTGPVSNTVAEEALLAIREPGGCLGKGQVLGIGVHNGAGGQKVICGAKYSPKL